MTKTAEIIKRLRSAGLSQSEIARRTGVSQTRISRWEGGAVPAAADDVLKLQALAQSLPEEAGETHAGPALVGEGA